MKNYFIYSCFLFLFTFFNVGKIKSSEKDISITNNKREKIQKKSKILENFEPKKENIFQFNNMGIINKFF